MTGKATPHSGPASGLRGSTGKFIGLVLGGVPHLHEGNDALHRRRTAAGRGTSNRSPVAPVARIPATHLFLHNGRTLVVIDALRQVFAILRCGDRGPACPLRSATAGRWSLTMTAQWYRVGWPRAPVPAGKPTSCGIGAYCFAATGATVEPRRPALRLASDDNQILLGSGHVVSLQLRSLGHVPGGVSRSVGSRAAPILLGSAVIA